MAEGRLDAVGIRAFLAAWDGDYVLAKDPALTRRTRATFAGVRATRCPLMLYRVAG